AHRPDPVRLRPRCRTDRRAPCAGSNPVNPSSRIQICDVGPRDGLQNESRFVPTPDKIELINRLSRCGLSRIEVTSFVSPRAIPQLADAEQVMQAIDRVPGVEYTVLVPNL